MAKLNNALRGKIRKETEKAKSSAGHCFGGRSSGGSTAYKTQFLQGYDAFKNGKPCPIRYKYDELMVPCERLAAYCKLDESDPENPIAVVGSIKIVEGKRRTLVKTLDPSFPQFQGWMKAMDEEKQFRQCLAKHKAA